MLAAPTIDLDVLSQRGKPRWLPLACSAVLHLLLALVWLGFPMPESKPQMEKSIQVELTAEPPRPVPDKPAPSAPEQAKSPPAREQGMPIPQLEEGMLAQRSSQPKAPPSDRITPPQPKAEIAPKPRKPEPVTQNERDFVLGQVLRHWAPPRELSAYDKAAVHVTVTVEADGYFAEAYDARRPWSPAAVFDGYEALPPQDLQRRTIDAFYGAIRKAQPVRLPPELKAKAPFRVRLDFRFRDVR
ncbi:MAG TPA: hypothetical protein VK196_04065 [Magnetospirillum sp.]|nr:hypothetical protein [Magnetospirillum sp.]